jgi:amidase
VAHGSDGAGSIRIPAACCGLVGLKPSRGRISSGPELGDSFLSTSGALTRYVADSAALLDVMAGYEPGDATWAPPPDEPFAVQAARPSKRLRVALTMISPLGTPVDPMCAQAALDAAQVLRDLGHEVEEVTPPDWPKPELIPVFTVLWAAGFAATTRWGEAIARRPATPEDVEAVTWMFYQQGIAQRAADYVGAMTQLQGFSRRLVAFLMQYDALLTPALAQRPLPVGYLDTNGADPQAEFMKAAVFTPFTPVFNMTGQPAISIPLFQGTDGVPLAVQIVGRPLAEGTLLSLAAQLEAAHPWAGRMPGH